MPSLSAPPVVVEVPVTLKIEVAFPGPASSDASALAQSVAYRAAECFAHASHAEIRAFNAVNGLHEGAAGGVTTVTSIVHGIEHAA